MEATELLEMDNWTDEEIDLYLRIYGVGMCDTDTDTERSEGNSPGRGTKWTRKS